MRILMSIHSELNANMGAPGVTWNLAREFEVLGCRSEVLSFCSMPGIARHLPTIGKQVMFPWYIANELRRRTNEYDVADLSSGDGWVYQNYRRDRTKLFVARSHGLEHASHDARVEQAKSGHLKLSWRYPLYHGGYRLWEVAKSFASADLSLFLSQSDCEYAIEHLRVDPGKTAIIDNGVGKEFLGRPLTSEEVTQHDTFRIALIGSYVPRKIGVAIPALNRLLARHRKLWVGFFGTGLSEARVLADFADSVRGRVRIVPQYKNGGLPALLDQYQILLFPSVAEGFALGVYEAMACGLAVVASDLPPLRERLRHEHTVLFVPRDDPSAIEDAVDRLILDTALLRTLQENGYVRAQDFSWSRIAWDAACLYGQFLDKKRREIRSVARPFEGDR